MQHPAAPPVLDPEQVAALRASMSPEDFRTLKRLVAVDLLALVDKLGQAAGPPLVRASLAGQAHRLKGTALTMGGSCLAAAAARLEAAPPDEAEAEILSLIVAIADAAHRLEAALSALPDD